ncbi:MAG: polysaccharide deacetylase family protein, partial [Planctomycetota bacterium]|nr:polysaccharide deacetylase family protein [Planctomycetota bacterium]
MTRFHIATLAAAAASLTALLLPDGATRAFAVGAVWMCFAGVTALGVAFPSLQFFGPVATRGSGDRPVVALTFDDGPDPYATPELLDLLKREGVRAAFFFVGERVDAHPEIAARAFAEGHLLCNHSYRHSNATNLFGSGRLEEDLRKTQDAIARAAGAVPAYFRPPMG